MRRGEEQRMLTELLALAEHTRRLSTWEMDFVDSIHSQLESGRNLTDKQRDKIFSIYNERVLDYVR